MQIRRASDWAILSVYQSNQLNFSAAGVTLSSRTAAELNEILFGSGLIATVVRGDYVWTSVIVAK